MGNNHLRRLAPGSGGNGRLLTEAVTRVSGPDFDRLCDAEEAKVDVFRTPLKLAAEKDVWPRALYSSGI